MSYVKTSRFPLPTVTRADGTLGAYVQASPNTSGPRFVWPQERIAIYQKQLQAARAAQHRKNLFSLLDVFGGKPSAQPSNIKKAPVQSSARGSKAAAVLKGLGDTITADTYVGSDGCVYDTDGNRLTCPGANGQQMPSKDAQLSKLLQAGADFVNSQAAAAAANSGNKVAARAPAATPAPQQPQQVPNTWPALMYWATQNKGAVITGGLALGALVLGLAAGKRR